MNKITETANLAISLMNKYGLLGWSFKFDKAFRRLGCCNYRTKTISLSSVLTPGRTDAEIRNTILHEIAHAICGPHAGHGSEWAKVAKFIGCDAKRCGSSSGDKSLIPPTKFVLECGNCGNRVPMHRKPRRDSACSRCCKQHSNGKFDRRFQLKLVENNKRPEGLAVGR